MIIREQGAVQKLQVLAGAIDLATIDYPGTSGDVSLERGPYSMSDNFGGTGENSEDTIDEKGRFNQRWIFEPFNIPVYTYDLETQTERTTTEYTSVAQTTPTVYKYTPG